ncbi:MAG: semialdehyde dehydrogenase [SAR116 cluster bacterium]|jgi:NAD binding domain of 6-phosphogluconate dehydrogenase.|nr:semialdehyde dehydrogenase [Paracoccaceae bacterium]RCL78596.1 MAG: semialdehyde dehydrogenase [SAR116 cluster bacterium]RPH14110.1 MAG: semialdehyde dehydrogenase [Alphaproteobacteria bacterium TMED150]|tara:strand:- start:2340 stop:3179 length:840 start_codon:yes stop_codon:yes gene_type:complete
MLNIALLGAGGKMGVRIARNLNSASYVLAPIEVTEAGQTRLKEETGLDCVAADTALSNADVVVMAVPDSKIGTIAHGFVDRLKSGAAVIVLDAAAPFAGLLPVRDDITFFCTHPCHPHILEAHQTIEAQQDYFGGIAAPQGIVCALIQGPEKDYKICEDIAKVIYAPVSRSHRCSLENIAVLEPALSETIGATMAMALRQATDRAISMGVPEAAAHDFILGHLKIELAIAFGIFPEGRFSDGALMAIDKAQSVVFQPDWLDKVFDLAAIKKSVTEICDG